MSFSMFASVSLLAGLTCFYQTECTPTVSQGPMVVTKLGRIQGTQETMAGYSYDQFLGIRYGYIPQRFSYSEVTSKPWEGVYKATSFGPACTQVPYEGTSEDCLFVNIWRPVINGSSETPTEQLPVLLWVHGSGWKSGSGAKNRGDMLAAQGNVIVATINYRLGAFGFAFGGDGIDMNGNQGISDVITALHWTRENIAHFGGDPDRVTLGGHSAGSMIGSVIPVLSHLDHSLYSRLWLLSGVSVNPLFIEDASVGLAKTRLLATKVGCDQVKEGPLTHETLECLRKVDAKVLIERNQDDDIKILGGAEVAAFIPVYGSPMIPQPLMQLFRSNYNSSKKFIMVNGIHKDESAAFWGYLKPQNKSEARSMVWEKLSYVKKDLKVEQFDPFFDYYFHSTREDEKSLRTSLTNFMNDYSFRCTSLALSEIYSTAHSVRFAEFTYILDKYGPANRPDGPWHADSIELYFGEPFRPNQLSPNNDTGTYSEQDEQMSARLIRSLADYVYGSPLIDWPELHFNQTQALNRPVIRDIGYEEKNTEYDRQFICVQWSKLLDFDITLR